MRWVIGDIHGMLEPLEALVERVGKEDPGAEFLFVGDYVNRGPNSRGVIEFLLTLGHARFVRGNHDDVFDQVINGRSYTGKTTEEEHLQAFQWFMQYGLDQTLLSYGAEVEFLVDLAARPSGKGLRQLASLVPDDHKRFIRYLPATIEEKDFFIAHAKWDPDQSTEASLLPRLQRSEQLRHQIIWGRFSPEEVFAPKAWQKEGIFGHTPVMNYMADDPTGPPLPVRGPSIVLLDTALVLGPEGRLTAYCIESGEFIQTDRAARVIGS